MAQPTADDVQEGLDGGLARVADHAALAWLQAQLAGAPTTMRVRAVMAGVARRFSTDALPGRPGWSQRDGARAVAVRAGLAAGADATALMAELLRTGEIGEQESLLRMLTDLPEPERFVDLAVQSCRTNAVSVFRAIACDNAYPAAYFSAAAFRQLVLKTIFLELPALAIIGLRARVDAELVRMLGDYADERRAAGRSVPEDIAHVIAMGDLLP